MPETLAGSYLLQGEIARGPHGVLWRAKHRETAETVAAKVLHEEFAADARVVERFVRERSVLMAFVHPAFVRVRDLEAAPGHLMLVTELVAGTDLAKELAGSGALPAGRAIGIAASCAEALAAAHRAGVVHGDIKPSNIIVASASTAVRLTDCRIARLARGRREAGEQLPDPRYAAPERERGAPPLPATDVYGIGLVLYEMLTGAPAPGDDVSRQPAAVDPRVGDVVSACLDPDPERRPTAAQLVEWLQDLEPAPAQPLPARPAAAKAPVVAGDVPARRGRHRTLLVGGAVACVGLVATTMFAVGKANGLDLAPPGVRATDMPSLVSGTGAPVLPTDATIRDGAGAAAFVRFWFDALNYAVATGDTRPLAAASSPDCAACTAAVTMIGDASAAGRRMQGGVYTVRSVQPDSFFDLNRPTFRVVFDRSPSWTVDAAGRQIAQSAGVTFATCQIVLERNADSWRLHDNQSSSAVG